MKCWKIFITFNFITFTRIWFKLDEARVGPFKESGLTDYEADKLPMDLLNQITFHFNFSIDYFLKFIDTYQIPLIIMLAGFIVHWLPNKVKNFYEKTL